jgi:hypothetical protein
MRERSSESASAPLCCSIVQSNPGAGERPDVNEAVIDERLTIDSSVEDWGDQPVDAVAAVGWVLSNPVCASSRWYVVHDPLGAAASTGRGSDNITAAAAIRQPTAATAIRTGIVSVILNE